MARISINNTKLKRSAEVRFVVDPVAAPHDPRETHIKLQGRAEGSDNTVEMVLNLHDLAAAGLCFATAIPATPSVAKPDEEDDD